MGYELRIRGVGGTWPPTVVSPETFLERLPQRSCLVQSGLTWTSSAGAIELRQRTDPSAMPDVSVVIEEGGFCLLDNNTTLASLVLGELVRYLVGHFDSVSISEP